MATFAYTITQAPSRNPPKSGERTRVLGKDVFFDRDYRITPSGDLLLVEGIEALRQAVMHRLLTSPGDYKTEPTYGVGVPKFVKARNRPAELQRLRNRIVDQLSLDFRVSQVVDVVVENLVGAEGVRIGIKVRANGETLEFRPFLFTEAALGGIDDGSA